MDDRLISLNMILNAIDANNGILYDNPTLVASLKKMINALPSAQPTLYGYDLKNLIIFADAVRKKEITESEIENFVRNARAAWEYAWEEFQRTQKEALDSIM